MTSLETKPTSKRNSKYWRTVVTGSAILLGLILLVSGTGKLPGQTEFADALLKSFWTADMARFIAHGLPWVETALGVLLIFGVFPRMVAVLCILLTAGFIANNGWALANGVAKFPECAYCFGIWEDIFGRLSPLGALILDIILVSLALIVVVFHRQSFLNFRPWFIRRKEEVL